MQNEFANEILFLDAIGEVPAEELEDLIVHIMAEDARRAPRLRQQQFGRFDLNAMSEEEVKLNFRFTRGHIILLKNLLNIPDNIEFESRYNVSGLDAFCMLLRRFVYPNRLFDLESLFGYSAAYISRVCNRVMQIIHTNKGHKLNNLNELQWLDENRLRFYAMAIQNRGAPLDNCWGFIDGTARGICRPGENQENFYSGHKRMHCVKYQSIMCPDGIITSLIGAYPGRRHDAGIFRESEIMEQLQEKATYGEQIYCIYGDPAYPASRYVRKPHSRVNITPEQQDFNTRMATVRQAVEWGFSKIIRLFAFLDFKKNQKLLLQDVTVMYKVAALLANCHTCLYSSQVASFFNINPPPLDEYLR